MRVWLVRLFKVVTALWWTFIFARVFGIASATCYPSPCPDSWREAEITKTLIWGPLLHALFFLGAWAVDKRLLRRRGGG